MSSSTFESFWSFIDTKKKFEEVNIFPVLFIIPLFNNFFSYLFENDWSHTKMILKKNVFHQAPQLLFKIVR